MMKMMMMRRFALHAWLCALPLLSACAMLGTLNKVEGAVAENIVTDQQESQLGLQMKQELETKQGVKYVADAQVADYVRGVANKVLGPAKGERPGVQWTVNVIDDPKTVNAFATAGGYLYVYTGLLLLADDEAELAGVMGHEVGHVVGRHIARQMVSKLGIDVVSQVALGQNPGVLAQLGAAAVKGGAMLAHSRSDEDEADEFGVRYASAAGYDPRALGRFFEKLKAKTGDTKGLATWLSDHPATSDRINHINGYIAARKLGGSDVGADRFAAIRTRVEKLPPNSGTSTPTGTASTGGSPPASPPPSGAPPN